MMIILRSLGRRRFSRAAVVTTCVCCLMLGDGPQLLAEPVMAEPTNVEPTYLLGPEDILKVAVWKDEQLTQEAVVRPDGLISFPLIG